MDSLFCSKIDVLAIEFHEATQREVLSQNTKNFLHVFILGHVYVQQKLLLIDAGLAFLSLFLSSVFIYIITFEGRLGINYLLAITVSWKCLPMSLSVLIDVWPQMI